MSFCATCLKDLTGEEIRREPLGRNDAVVTLCIKCACDEPRVVQVVVRKKRDKRVDRAAWLTAHRNSLADRGPCINGARHPRPTEGRRSCDECIARKSKKRAA